MKDMLVLALILSAMWIFYRIMVKQPILPWSKSKVNSFQVKTKQTKKKKNNKVGIDEEPELFQELFSDLKEISNHMIRFHDNQFTLIAEVEPVNYFLKSQDEQESIDIIFERWLAQINYNVQFYLQNRYIDLTDPIEQMRKSMEKAEDLNEAALSYGQSMIDDLIKWQTIAPRYETKRYLIFTFKVKTNNITADSPEELEEKITDKAFAELYRRFNTAKSQLRRANIHLMLLPTEGIYDLLYHTFNRRKAVKNRFKDSAAHEVTALYATADQSSERIEAVKELIDKDEQSEGENEEIAS